MTLDEQAGAWKPPYLSYETLTNFFEKKIGANPLPPRIDTHFLDNYAGSVRPMLIMTLRTMGMLGENNEVLEPLRIAVRNPESRKEVIFHWAVDFYAEQVALAEQNATAAMLWESFTRHGYSGSTLRKAVVFYLALAEDLDLPSSPHFKPPRQPVAGTTQRRRATPTPARTSVAAELPPISPQQVAGENKVISLGDAGSVSVTVNVRWLDLPDETFTKLRQVIRDLESLMIPDGNRKDIDDEEDSS